METRHLNDYEKAAFLLGIRHYILLTDSIDKHCEVSFRQQSVEAEGKDRVSH